MKKLMLLAFALILAAGGLTGCEDAGEGIEEAGQEIQQAG